MEGTFQLILIIVVVVAILAAIATMLGNADIYKSIGRGGLSMDEPDRPAGPPPQSSAATAEVQAEIRQMIEAKAARREARGEAPIDVDAEIAALSGGGGTHDAALRDEVRQLVVARNERRVRQGKEPLDVEAEVERQLRDLG